MDRLPPELQNMITGYITIDLPAANSTTKELHLDKAYEGLLTLFQLALTSRYHHLLLSPAIEQGLENILQNIEKAPWQIFHFLDRAQAPDLPPYTNCQFTQLAKYLDCISKANNTTFRKWIVKETAPNTPYRLNYTKSLGADWCDKGRKNFGSAWLKGIKLGGTEFAASFTMARAGLCCWLKSLNPDLIKLRYIQDSYQIEILTKQMVKEQALEKRRDPVMGLDLHPSTLAELRRKKAKSGDPKVKAEL